MSFRFRKRLQRQRTGEAILNISHFAYIARGFNHGDTKDCHHDCVPMIVSPWLKPRAMFS